MLHHRAVRRLVAFGAIALVWIVAAGGGCAGGTETLEDDGAGGDSTVVTTTGGTGGTSVVGTGGVVEFPCGVDCAAIATPQCQVAQCNTVTEQCEVVNDEDSVACDDGVFCTISDSCSAGMCVGGPQNDCGMTPPACTEVTCDETSQSCSTAPSMNGAPCQEANLCIKGSTCTNGLCLGGMLDNCFFEPVPDECHISQCDTADGICKPVPGNEGLPCTDLNDLCTINKTCMTGVCQGGTAMDCSQLTQNCDIGICDTTNGMCTTMAVMNGQPCDDLNGCTTGETCSNQMCINGTPVTTCSLTGDGCCPSNCNATNDLDCQILPSCNDIKLANPGSLDGVYTIDADGPGPGQPFDVYCDMTTGMTYESLGFGQYNATYPGWTWLGVSDLQQTAVQQAFIWSFNEQGGAVNLNPGWNSGNCCFKGADTGGNELHFGPQPAYIRPANSNGTFNCNATYTDTVMLFQRGSDAIQMAPMPTNYFTTNPPASVGSCGENNNPAFFFRRYM